MSEAVVEIVAGVDPVPAVQKLPRGRTGLAQRTAFLLDDVLQLRPAV